MGSPVPSEYNDPHNVCNTCSCSTKFHQNTCWCHWHPYPIHKLVERRTRRKSYPHWPKWSRQSAENQENKRSLKLLRDTIEKQRTEIDELKAQVDWLQEWIGESLTLPIGEDPGFNVDPTKRHVCPCGCGNRILDNQRDKSVYFTRGCKDRVRQRIRYLRKKAESQ